MLTNLEDKINEIALKITQHNERLEKVEELLKTEKIQVSLWDDLPPHIKFRILRDGKNVLIHDDKEFQRIRERTLIEYWDHNIWYEKMLDMSLKNMDVST